MRAVQRLVSHHAVSKEAVPAVLSLLSDRYQDCDTNSQIRVLQCIVALVTNVHLHNQQLAQLYAHVEAEQLQHRPALPAQQAAQVAGKAQAVNQPEPFMVSWWTNRAK